MKRYFLTTHALRIATGIYYLFHIHTTWWHDMFIGHLYMHEYPVPHKGTYLNCSNKDDKMALWVNSWMHAPKALPAEQIASIISKCLQCSLALDFTITWQSNGQLNRLHGFIICMKMQTPPGSNTISIILLYIVVLCKRLTILLNKPPISQN